MWVVDVEFNVVSILHIYMGAALATDFTSHIIHTYYSTPGNKVDRLNAIIKLNCTSIPNICIIGLLSLIIFVIPSNTYLFSIFAKVWAGIIIFTLTHSLLVLPTLLSFIGPITLTEYNPKIEAVEKIKERFDWEEEKDQGSIFDEPEKHEIEVYRDEDIFNIKEENGSVVEDLEDHTPPIDSTYSKL